MKCYKCGKKTNLRLTPDLDLKGIGFCKKHESIIRLAYMVANTIEEFDKIIGTKQKDK